MSGQACIVCDDCANRAGDNAGLVLAAVTLCICYFYIDYCEGVRVQDPTAPNLGSVVGACT